MPKLWFSLLFAYFSSRIILSYKGKSKILVSLTTYGLLTPKWKPLMLFLEVVYSSEQNCLKSVEEKTVDGAFEKFHLWASLINTLFLLLKTVIKLFSEIKRNDSPLSYKEKVKNSEVKGVEYTLPVSLYFPTCSTFTKRKILSKVCKLFLVVSWLSCRPGFFPETLLL